MQVRTDSDRSDKTDRTGCNIRDKGADDLMEFENNSDAPNTLPEDNMQDRVDRLSGEQAPDITPEEFARLQRSGSIHIDAHGRIRANRREETDPGVSLRKRRAWYAGYSNPVA
jgi:hypothetical protein